MVLESLTFLAATVVFLLVTAAAYIGSLALIGAVRLIRCDRCGHLTVVSARVASTCAWCRHDYVTHPLQALHEHAPHAFRRS